MLSEKSSIIPHFFKSTYYLADKVIGFHFVIDLICWLKQMQKILLDKDI